MRITFVSASGSLGGAERVLLDLLRWSRQRRMVWAPSLVSLEDGPLVERARKMGLEVAVLPVPEGLAALGEAGRTPAGLAVGLAQLARPVRRFVADLRSAITRQRPDVVHSNGIKAHLLLALAGTASAPLVWHMHDYLGSRPTTSRLLQLLASRCNLALATSEDLTRDVAGALRGGPPVVTVKNAVDVDELTRAGFATDLDALAGLPAPAPGTVRVGLIATFARWKGHDVFLRSLNSLRHLPVRGYIIGGPVYRTAGSQWSLEELRRLAEDLDLGARVGFTGFQDDRAGCLRSLDIVVHASTAPEPFGLVVAEAMAAGCAVVSSATGGSAELLERDVDALVHRAGDPDSLADAIATLVATPERRADIGRRAAESARSRFALDRFGSEIDDVYRRLVSARAA